MRLDLDHGPERGIEAGGLLVPLVAVAALALAWRLFPDPSTPLALAVVLLALVVAWLQPALPALICIAFSAFRLQEAYPILHPYQLPLLTAAWSAAGLAAAVARGRLAVAWNPTLLGVLALIAWTTAASLASTDPETSLSFWSESFVKIVIVTGALALTVRSDRDFAMLQGTIVVCGVALGVAAFWNHLIGSQLVEETRVTIGRDLGSPLGDPNDLALMLTIALAFTLSALAATRGAMPRVALAAAALVIFVAVSLTQSRGALLAVAAVLLVIAWRRIPSKGLAIAVCVGGAAVLFLTMDLGSRVSGGRGEEGVGESAQLRVELWKIALRQTIDHPLFGIGPQTFHRIAEEFTGRAITVHNTPIQAAVEAGLPGLAALALTIGSAFLANARAERSGSMRLQAAALGAQGALAAFCVAGLFLSQAFNWALYLVIAPALALRFRLAAELRAEGGAS